LKRFTVSYQIFSKDEKKVIDIAESITLEETVEIPKDIVPKGFIQDEIVGRIEEISKINSNSFLTKISYSEKSVGKEILQLLNIMHGNSSMFDNVKVVNIELNKSMNSIFPGSRFGIKGIRKILNHNNSIIAPVLKPQGLSSEDLANIAYKCALAGADLVKEDHNLVNQNFSPYKERVEKISLAVKKANKQTGKNCLYFPHIASNYSEISNDIKFAKDYEVGGIM
jgi:ribulose-bisphosphate carboxylase large chain